MADEYERQIQALIDSFPDDRYEELLEVMADMAQTALDARREERGDPR
jgi:hypothetical protein